MTNKTTDVNTLTPPAVLLAVAESMATLHGRATIRLRRGFGRGLLTIDDTEGGYTYTETWRDSYRHDSADLTREEAIETVAREQAVLT